VRHQGRSLERHQGGRGKGRWLGALLLWTSVACATPPRAQQPGRAPARNAFRPGVTVLLDDSLQLIAGRRIALVTNHTGVDLEGTSIVDLLRADPRVKRANVTLVRLFSPEHGIRGDKDVTDLPDELDARSGLMVHSLYRRETMGPPDSLLRDLDGLVFDLQDIGTRTWTYVGVMVYSMRAAARAGIPFVVLDRPNPLGGRAEGLLLDSALANPEDPTPARRGQAYALYPHPLRHGMTNGELARWFAADLKIPVQLSVVRMSGYRRSMWWEETGLPWTVPSPSMATTASALLYPALVPFEGSNLSVGRGTSLPFQQFGASWLDARRVARELEERGLGGVRFEAVRFTPERPGDAKFAGREIPGVRIVIEDRERVQSARIGAALLWAIARAAPDSLKLNARSFDLRLGASWAREALLRGDDPDEVIDRVQPDLVAFQRRVRPYLLY
jgi:uncharacterized protein YbbC (DUF1343 family)